MAAERTILVFEKDSKKARVAFRAFYRLMEHRAGRPDYPEPVTWSLIESWINGTIIEGGKSPRPPEPDMEADPRTPGGLT